MGLLVPEIGSGGKKKKKWVPIFFSVGGIFNTSADPPCPESTECCLILKEGMDGRPQLTRGKAQGVGGGWWGRTTRMYPLSLPVLYMDTCTRAARLAWSACLYHTWKHPMARFYSILINISPTIENHRKHLDEIIQ